MQGGQSTPLFGLAQMAQTGVGERLLIPCGAGVPRSLIVTPATPGASAPTCWRTNCHAGRALSPRRPIVDDDPRTTNWSERCRGASWAVSLIIGAALLVGSSTTNPPDASMASPARSGQRRLEQLRRPHQMAENANDPGSVKPPGSPNSRSAGARVLTSSEETTVEVEGEVASAREICNRTELGDLRRFVCHVPRSAL